MENFNLDKMIKDNIMKCLSESRIIDILNGKKTITNTNVKELNGNKNKSNDCIPYCTPSYKLKLKRQV